MGFTGARGEEVLRQCGIALDERGTIRADRKTYLAGPRIFTCGDMRRGQSLVVWAIREGRECAAAIHETF